MRTMLLGIAMLGVLLWGAVSQFDIPRNQVLESLLATLMAFGIVVVLAALAVAAYVGVRRLISRRENDG
jgi:formate-dependent nitrite reductase membrane component NrfD